MGDRTAIGQFFRLGVLSRYLPLGSWSGLGLIGLAIAARLLGFFEPIELKAFDWCLRLRPVEPLDERLLIVGIDDLDIQRIGTYPVPDSALSELLQRLQRSKPRAVGLDIIRDLPQEPGHQDFVDVLIAMPEVVGVEILGFGGVPPVSPPPALPDERIGFIDFLLDTDGFVRRVPLGSFDREGVYHYSLSLQLAQTYLNREEIALAQGVSDPHAMRLGETEVPLFYPNTGSYIRADASAQQTFVNPRNNKTPFRQVSFTEVMEGNVPSDWIKDKVVLVGITAISNKDLINSAAIASDNPGTVDGVALHAHATSQLIGAVLEGRPLLRTWPEVGEYLWIAIWGAAGILLINISTPTRQLIAVFSAGIGLIAIAYFFLLAGWWIPVVPPLFAFLINAVVLSRIVLYDRMMRSRIEESQRVVQRTYTAMHNGPLQTLALIMRDVERKDARTMANQLSQLNEEIRQLYTALEEDVAAQGNQFNLEQGFAALDLSRPLHELLYEVYERTLKRDFPHFKTLRRCITRFDPMQTPTLEAESIQALCRFLEGALCNVGLHAQGATQLKVSCTTQREENIISVEDNGQSAKSISSNRRSATDSMFSSKGSRQSMRLARDLQGSFNRSYLQPAGVRCELRWPVRIVRSRFTVNRLRRH